MAELLILLKDRRPGTDPLTAWDRGHILAVKPDGWTWGALEGKPNHVILQITDMSVEEAETYARAYMEIVDGSPVMISICEYKFDVDDPSIPNPIRNQIFNIGRVETTKASVLNFFKRTVP